jgi:hypothetical protein
MKDFLDQDLKFRKRAYETLEVNPQFHNEMRMAGKKCNYVFMKRE